MYYSEIRELDLKLSGKSGNYQKISVHELAGNPGLIQAQLIKGGSFIDILKTIQHDFHTWALLSTESLQKVSS